MDFKSQSNSQRSQTPMSNQAAPAGGQAEEPVTRQSESMNGMKNMQRNNTVAKVIGVVIALVVLLVAGLVGWKVLGDGTNGDATVDSKGYQAVFLTNGQVYFGKLTSLGGDYVTLNHIYYLQVQQAVQPKANSGTAPNNDVTLVKLGGELHGPTDEMSIAKDQILFWENLKSNGKVTEEIVKFEQKQAQ